MKKMIVWEKWRDDEHYHELSESMSTTLEEPDPIEMIDNDDDDDINIGLNVGVTVYPHIVKTPLGDFSVLDSNLPSKMFDCWIGHTNFPITHQEFEIIDNEIEGFEVFRVVSKYRFFIGVAKLFTLADISSQFIEKICNNNSVKLQENMVRSILSKNKDTVKWAAFIPNIGGFEYISSKISLDQDDEIFNTQLEKFKNRNDGTLLLSNNGV